MEERDLEAVEPKGFLIDTKLTIHAPEIAKVGDKVRIYGYLSWYCWWCLPPGWQPHEEGKTVELYIEGRKVAETKTKEDGYYEFYYTFEREGEYLIRTHYPGDLIKDKESWSDTVKIKVLSPKEYDQALLWTAVKYLAPPIVIPAVILIGYAIYRKRAEEEMMLIATMR